MVSWVGTQFVGGFFALLATALFGSAVVKLARFPHTVIWTVGAGLLGSLLARLQLHVFDRFLLARGRLPHLSHEQTLEWIRQNRAWRRARRTQSIYARPTEPDEQDKVFHTLERTRQQPRTGHWLCVGSEQEAWFQEKERLDRRYEQTSEVTKQFPFDERPFRYHVFKPRSDVYNWTAQVQGPGVASFSFRLSFDPTQLSICPAGTYVVMNDTPDPYRDELKDVWVVAKPLFEKTYEKLQG
jgi:hypothetical protein